MGDTSGAGRFDELAVAALFGTRSGHDVDKFAHCSWRPGEDGVPLLDASTPATNPESRWLLPAATPERG